MAEPTLDASGQEFNLRMTEGDPLMFTWIVPDAASWAGDYTFKAKVAEGTVISLPASVSADGDDGVFVISAAAQEELLPTESGYLWSIKDDAGPTRFNGLLFVEPSL